jgi:hypothetical protein
VTYTAKKCDVTKLQEKLNDVNEKLSEEQEKLKDDIRVLEGSQKAGSRGAGTMYDMVEGDRRKVDSVLKKKEKIEKEIAKCNVPGT